MAGLQADRRRGLLLQCRLTGANVASWESQADDILPISKKTAAKIQPAIAATREGGDRGGVKNTEHNTISQIVLL